MNKNYITCINILKQAFDANILAHRHAAYAQYELKNIYYRKKSIKIQEAIRLIKKYKLPIKWGLNDGIYYFCIYGRQISFHDFGNKEHKKYNGKRSCRKNLKFPF